MTSNEVQTSLKLTFLIVYLYNGWRLSVTASYQTRLSSIFLIFHPLQAKTFQDKSNLINKDARDTMAEVGDYL